MQIWPFVISVVKINLCVWLTKEAAQPTTHTLHSCRAVPDLLSGNPAGFIKQIRPEPDFTI